ncbi:MAG: Rne/Rng family ribonuclease [Deltaproteobacteria bacterium]|nr:Rne/Rng family ribonuclease [Deltaproteobacteria bacterium]
MSSELIINVTAQETRVALLENGILTELYIERESDKGIAGNIYKGRVQRVLAGMQASFVDIGLDRSSFLCADDVYDNNREMETMLTVFKDSDEDTELARSAGNVDALPPTPLIEDMVTDGKELLVQVIKEPLGSKGARISSHISLPGRYLVYLPTLPNIGISRKITDEEERERLKELVEKIKPEGCGFIIRTASESATEEELAMDMDFLIKLWENILSRNESSPVPNMLHEDLSIALRAIRDLYSKNVKKVVVDCSKTHASIVNFIKTFMPQLKYSVELYEGNEPIFDSYGIELEISRALGSRIWLKSGGYIIIEETEALVVIDVNTGRYVGKGNQEDTILKTNLEAVKEIAYQIRLRNLGGIIIVDFIDMQKKSSRENLLNTLQEALKKDRAKTNIVSMSDLGLVQMTRKRVRENLSGHMCDPCPYCEGRGVIRSIPSIAYDMLREIRKEASMSIEERITGMAHPDVVSFLYDEERLTIEELELRYKKRIILKADNSYHLEKFDIHAH